MKIAKGFKQTEYGVVPEHWESVTLEDNGKTYGGITGKFKKDFGIGDAFYIPFLNIMYNTLIDPEYKERVNIIPSEQQNLVKKGDVFFNGSSETSEELGYCSFLQSDLNTVYLNSFCFGYRIQSTGIIDGYFLAYYFRSQIGRKLMALLAQGATRYNLSKTNLLKMPIPLPPLKEQQAIVEVLSDMDRTITQTKTLIEKKKAIKQGMMQELLRPKEGWVEKKLRDIGLIITGSTPSTLIKEYWNGNIPWITPTDIGHKKNIYNSEREVSGSGFQKCRKLPKGTLLVTCIASIGKNAVLKVAGACNQQINAIIPNKEHDVDFLYYLMENNKSYLQTKAGITATLIISKKEFEDISFFFPPTHIEQSDIANILSEIEINIDIHVTKLQKLKLQKQGMMQALLTGRIRLT
jgi:type I restriction enzyme S subunit